MVVVVVAVVVRAHCAARANVQHRWLILQQMRILGQFHLNSNCVGIQVEIKYLVLTFSSSLKGEHRVRETLMVE